MYTGITSNSTMSTQEHLTEIFTSANIYKSSRQMLPLHVPRNPNMETTYLDLLKTFNDNTTEFLKQFCNKEFYSVHMPQSNQMTCDEQFVIEACLQHANGKVTRDQFIEHILDDYRATSSYPHLNKKYFNGLQSDNKLYNMKEYGELSEAIVQLRAAFMIIPKTEDDSHNINEFIEFMRNNIDSLFVKLNIAIKDDTELLKSALYEEVVQIVKGSLGSRAYQALHHLIDNYDHSDFQFNEANIKWIDKNDTTIPHRMVDELNKIYGQIQTTEESNKTLKQEGDQVQNTPRIQQRDDRLQKLKKRWMWLYHVANNGDELQKIIASLEDMRKKISEQIQIRMKEIDNALIIDEKSSKKAQNALKNKEYYFDPKITILREKNKEISRQVDRLNSLTRSSERRFKTLAIDESYESWKDAMEDRLTIYNNPRSDRTSINKDILFLLNSMIRKDITAKKKDPTDYSAIQLYKIALSLKAFGEASNASSMSELKQLHKLFLDANTDFLSIKNKEESLKKNAFDWLRYKISEEMDSIIDRQTDEIKQQIVDFVEEINKAIDWDSYLGKPTEKKQQDTVKNTASRWIRNNWLKYRLYYEEYQDEIDKLKKRINDAGITSVTIDLSTNSNYKRKSSPQDELKRKVARHKIQEDVSKTIHDQQNQLHAACVPVDRMVSEMSTFATEVCYDPDLRATQFINLLLETGTIPQFQTPAELAAMLSDASDKHEYLEDIKAAWYNIPVAYRGCHIRPGDKDDVPCMKCDNGEFLEIKMYENACFRNVVHTEEIEHGLQNVPRALQISFENAKKYCNSMCIQLSQFIDVRNQLSYEQFYRSSSERDAHDPILDVSTDDLRGSLKFLIEQMKVENFDTLDLNSLSENQTTKAINDASILIKEIKTKLYQDGLTYMGWESIKSSDASRIDVSTVNVGQLGYRSKNFEYLKQSDNRVCDLSYAVENFFDHLFYIEGIRDLFQVNIENYDECLTWIHHRE